MTEHQLQALIVNRLKTAGILCFETDVMSGLMFNSNRMAFIKHHQKIGYVKGQPDLVVCLKDKVVFVEVKSEKGKQFKDQKYFEEKCKKLNLEYYVWNDIKECDDFIKEQKGKVW